LCVDTLWHTLYSIHTMQWAIWIQSTRWKTQPPVDEIKKTFESMGFALRPQQFDYYNPHRHNRFIAQHAREGAITLWSLAWLNHWPNTRVVIEEYNND
jgi:hypothetical protein